MLYGTVVQFFPEKGYGFIQQDQGDDVFFHVTALGACLSTPEIETGQAVKYELEPRKASSANTREDDQNSIRSKKPNQLRARMVELIDALPGGALVDKKQPTSRHPRALQKKPKWRL